MGTRGQVTTQFSLDAWKQVVLATVIDPVLPPEERVSARPRVHLRDLRIINKRGELVAFVLNQEQRRFCLSIGVDTDDPDIDGLRLRELILKGRQQGFSTLILALVFLAIINYPNRRAVVVAHSVKSTLNIFEIVKTFHDNLTPEKRHTLRGDKSQTLHSADTNSWIQIGTAGTDDLMSGSTLHHIIKSERAKWKFGDPRKLRDLDASLDAAGKEGNIVHESTAKGRNHFEQDYNKALNGESNYRAHFFPWFEHDEYRKPVPAGVIFTDDEQTRMRDYGLTLEQMYWYRTEAVGEFGSLAAQEYPFNAEEAFISSAHGYFDAPALRLLNDRLKSSEYDPLGDVNLHPDAFPLLRQAYQEGLLSIWETPKDGRSYVLPADVARGEGEYEDDDSDFDCADVFDTQTMAQAAQLRGKWDCELYAELLYELGHYYHWALLAPENNGYGWNVVTALRRMEYPERKGRATKGLYLHDKSLITETRRPKPDTLLAGWPTDKHTKPFALRKFNSLLIADAIGINSRVTVREMFTFVRKAGGELEAEGTAHDDAVMSAAIGAALLSLVFDEGRRTPAQDVQPVTQPSGAYAGRGARR